MTAPSIDQTPQGWDATVEDYERSSAPFFARFAADALHLVGVQPGHRVLDVAAGPGTLALLAARRGAAVVATDFAPGMVERLRQRAGEAGLTNLSAAVMDGQALTLPDNSFDAAFSIFGLIFFPERAAGFRELYRVVRPGGKVAVAAWSAKSWNIGSIFARAARHALPAPPTPAAPRPALSLQDPDAFLREMGEAGFARVDIQTVVHRSELPTPAAAWEAVRKSRGVGGITGGSDRRASSAVPRGGRSAVRGGAGAAGGRSTYRYRNEMTPGTAMGREWWDARRVARGRRGILICTSVGIGAAPCDAVPRRVRPGT